LNPGFTVRKKISNRIKTIRAQKIKINFFYKQYWSTLTTFLFLEANVTLKKKVSESFKFGHLANEDVDERRHVDASFDESLFFENFVNGLNAVGVFQLVRVVVHRLGHVRHHLHKIYIFFIF